MKEEDAFAYWSIKDHLRDRNICFLKMFIVCVCAKSLVISTSLWFYGPQPARLLCPWDSPGKNTGVDCHVILQGIFLTRDQTHISYISCSIGRQVFLITSTTGKAKKMFTKTLKIWRLWQEKWRAGKWQNSELGPPEDLKKKQKNLGNLRLFLSVMEGETPAIVLRINKWKKLETSHESLLRSPTLDFLNLEVVGSLPTW